MPRNTRCQSSIPWTNGVVPLFIGWKDPQTLCLLLDHKADPTWSTNDRRGRTSIAGIYAYRGHSELLNILITRGVKLDFDVLLQAARGQLSSENKTSFQQNEKIFCTLRKELEPNIWKKASTAFHKQNKQHENFSIVERFFPLPEGREVLRELDQYAVNAAQVGNLERFIVQGCQITTSDIILIIRDYALSDYFLLDVAEKSNSCLYPLTLLPPRIWCIILRLQHIASWIFEFPSVAKCGPHLFRECSERWDSYSCGETIGCEHHIHIGEMIGYANIVSLVEEEHIQSMPFSFKHMTEKWQHAYKQFFLNYLKRYRQHYLELHSGISRFAHQDEVLGFLREATVYFTDLPELG